MKRTHTVESSSAPNSAGQLGNAEEVSENDSSLGSPREDSAGEEMGRPSAVTSDKTSLMAKLQELETEKEQAMAKFDGDIVALKRVLSLM